MKRISDVSCACLIKEHTTLKARKLIKILKSFHDIKNPNILDVGTGTGQVAHELSKVAKCVTSIDVVDERTIKGGYKFLLVKNEKIPFPDNSFDIVISNQVIEHIKNQQLHVNEMYRVCKKGGIVFIGTPNKWWYKDVHYHLPFITLMPRWFANKYMRIFKKGKDYDIFPLSYSQLKDMTRKFSEINNVSIDVVMRPEYYGLDILKPLQPIAKNIPYSALKALNLFFPAYLIVLRK